MEAAYEFRPYKPEDTAFIQSSWGSSFYKGLSYRHLLSPDSFHKFHRPARSKILEREDAKIIICAAKKDPSLIMAWLSLEQPKNTEMMIVHYIYVKEAFKGEKLATALLSEINPRREVFYSHLTDKAQRIISRNHDKFKHWIYAPQLI